MTPSATIPVNCTYTIHLEPHAPEHRPQGKMDLVFVTYTAQMKLRTSDSFVATIATFPSHRSAEIEIKSLTSLNTMTS